MDNNNDLISKYLNQPYDENINYEDLAKIARIQGALETLFEIKQYAIKTGNIELKNFSPWLVTTKLCHGCAISANHLFNFITN